MSMTVDKASFIVYNDNYGGSPDGIVAPDGVIKGVSNSLLAGAGTTSATSFLDDEVNGMSTAGSTITRVGTKFIVRAKPTTTAKSALITIIGNETGGFKTVSVSVAINLSATYSDIQATR